MEPKRVDRRPRVMTNKWAPALLLVLLQACGATAGDQNEAAQGKRDDKRYEATGMVFQQHGRRPLLRLGVILTSLPPQCGSGDVLLTGWDWDGVKGEKRRGDTVWGRYQITGAFHGRSFLVMQVGRPARDAHFLDGDSLETPCNQPKEGWKVLDSTRSGESDVSRSNAAVAGDAEFAGLWVTRLVQGSIHPSSVLLNVAFTANLENHEQELRTYWGGPLCVIKHRLSMKRLQQIQSEELGHAVRELGVAMMSSDIDVDDNVVELMVVTLDESEREAIEDRFGSDTIRVTPALSPVDDGQSIRVPVSTWSSARSSAPPPHPSSPFFDQIHLNDWPLETSLIELAELHDLRKTD